MGAKVEPVPNLIGESGQALSPVSGRAAPARSVGRGVLARADETGLTALGQVRRTTRLEPEVGFRQSEPPWGKSSHAGRWMTSAAEVVDGIKEANHAHRDPIIYRLS
jgi:hypothetical protein